MADRVGQCNNAEVVLFDRDENDSRKPYYCKYCGMQFYCYQALGGHQRVHKIECPGQIQPPKLFGVPLCPTAINGGTGEGTFSEKRKCIDEEDQELPKQFNIFSHHTDGYTSCKNQKVESFKISENQKSKSAEENKEIRKWWKNYCSAKTDETFSGKHQMNVYGNVKDLLCAGVGESTKSNRNFFEQIAEPSLETNQRNKAKDEKGDEEKEEEAFFRWKKNLCLQMDGISSGENRKGIYDHIKDEEEELDLDLHL